jgi:hypothetical protein
MCFVNIYALCHLFLLGCTGGKSAF